MRLLAAAVLLVFVLSVKGPQVRGETSKSQSDTHTPEETHPPQQTVVIENNVGRKITEKDEPHATKTIDYVTGYSTFVIAAFTIVMSIAVIFQVITARRTERAWIIGNVVNTNFERPPDPNEELHCVVSIKNTGRTPATITRAGISAKLSSSLSDLPALPQYGKNEKVSFSHLLLVPKDSFALSAQTIIEVAQYDAFMSRRLFLYVHGFVEYRDTFNRKHETRFCDYYLVPDGGGILVEGFQRNIEAPPEYNKAT